MERSSSEFKTRTTVTGSKERKKKKKRKSEDCVLFLTVTALLWSRQHCSCVS